MLLKKIKELEERLNAQGVIIEELRLENNKEKKNAKPPKKI